MDWIYENYLLLVIPITSGIVGWATNFLAVKMMFYPIKFIGIRPIFGWQGLIPMKRREMAEIEVELVLGKLLSVQELTERLDPDILTMFVDRRLKQVLRRIINQVMEESAPTLWASLPVQGKDLVYKRVEADIPNVVRKMIDDLKHNIDEILDIKELVVNLLVDEPELINEIFLKAGEKEFPFIEKSGLYFGFLFGLVTLAVWTVYPVWWILPAGGLLVGYLTNWIAIKIIFEPKQPINIFGYKLQGMFLKRQDEVSRVYSDIVQAKLINAKNITQVVLNGSGSGQLLELIELHVNDAIERYVAVAQPYFALGVGSEQYYKMKKLAAQQIFDNTEKYMHYANEYADKALRVGDDLCERMRQLSPEEFEGVLRPAYEADEWKLILTGAILGMIAGFMQLYLV